MGPRWIILSRGSVRVGGVYRLPGTPFQVSEEIFEYLVGARSITLQFEEVAEPGLVPHTDGDLGTGDHSTGDQDDGHDEPDIETHTGEGETVDQDDEVPPETGSTPAAPAPLAPVVMDAKLAKALADAGWDTREKLRTATVLDLMKVQGVGKVRAEAILAEVNG